MRWVLVIASILGASSVLVGAAMRHIGTNANMDILQTALKYHQLYSVVLLALGLYMINKTASWKVRLAPILFTAGIIIFSGSLAYCHDKIFFDVFIVVCVNKVTCYNFA